MWCWPLRHPAEHYFRLVARVRVDQRPCSSWTLTSRGGRTAISRPGLAWQA
jgi:hypothetical protein